MNVACASNGVFCDIKNGVYEVFTTIFHFHGCCFFSFIDFILSALLLNLAHELDFNKKEKSFLRSHYGSHIVQRKFAQIYRHRNKMHSNS